jgi:hypothetical protein
MQVLITLAIFTESMLVRNRLLNRVRLSISIVYNEWLEWSNDTNFLLNQAFIRFIRAFVLFVIKEEMCNLHLTCTNFHGIDQELPASIHVNGCFPPYNDLNPHPC